VATTAPPTGGTGAPAVVPPSVVGELPTTGQPVEIAVAGGSLWAPDDGGVERFTPPGPDAQPAGRVDLGSPGYGNDMIVDDDTLFVTRYQGRALASVDLATGDAGDAPVSMPGQALTGTVSGDTLWLTVHGSSSGAPGSVVAVRDGAVVDEIALEQRPYQIEAVADRLWVTFFEAGSIGLIDPATHDVTIVPIGERPVDVRLLAGQLWVTVSGEDRIALVDPTSGTTTASIDVGDSPWKVDEGFGAVWVTNQGDGQSIGSVMRIDPTTHEVGEPIAVGVKPDEIAIGADHVFVGNVGSQTISVIDPGT
jgi:streptogramin lyase